MNTTPDQGSEVFLVEVSDIHTLDTYSLVLAAADISHRVNLISSHRMEIYVAPSLRQKAQNEIHAYILENDQWPPPVGANASYTPTFRAMSPLLIGCLVGIHGMSGDWQAEAPWFAKGAGNSTAILTHGELFRLVTSLALHADLVHLLSNCFLGIFLLHFYLQLTGNGLGLAAMLVTAVAANYLNVLVHGSGHMFVGFSTALFAVIGMLCTMSFAFKTARFFLHFFMPIMAGLALLALLGSEGERTDLGSHLFGLGCGLLGGNLVRLPFFFALRASWAVQTLLASLVFAIFYGCWLLAFSR
jgi:membrane associated rhomboid family serine protease